MEIPSNIDAKTQACNLLPVLGLMMDCVEQKLVKVSLWSLFQDMEMKLLPILAGMYQLLVMAVSPVVCRIV